MKTLVDARLKAEAARFGFRFACEDCAHFHEGHAGGPDARAADLERCSLGYPAEPRRHALDGPHLETCKDFDVV